MRNHITTVAGSDGAWQGKCSCRQRGPVTPDRQQAEDWTIAHDRQVERAKAHLRTHNPSLASQRDYFQAQADDYTNPVHDRHLWQMLADEVDHRLNDHANYWEERLF